MTFAETLREHLDAIRGRDLDRLMATLPGPESPIVLITSHGRLVRSVPEFRAMHRDWFAADGWSLAFEPVETIEIADQGVAVIRLDYRDRGADGREIRERSMLTLVFARRGDRWAMVHDQNTPIRGET